MKGQLQKRTGSSALACHSCRWFEDDDPDIFYCELQREEFPGLCDEYQQAGEWADSRMEWTNDDSHQIPNREPVRDDDLAHGEKLVGNSEE